MEGNYLNRNTTQQREDHSFGFEDHSWGTSWPARNYACSFCKREFRSAQALGGHMNVHRRDRARLRSSLSSWVNSSDQCPKPNPNTKPNNNPSNVLHQPSSSTSPLSDHELLNCPQYPPPCLNLSSSSPSTASTSGDKKPRLTFTPSHHFPLLSPQRREINNNTRNGFIVEEEMKGSCEEEEDKVYKNNEQNITLELGLGLVEHQEEKLDLELRL